MIISLEEILQLSYSEFINDSDKDKSDKTNTSELQRQLKSCDNQIQDVDRASQTVTKLCELQNRTSKGTYSV